MSMYTLLHGENVMASILLSALGLTRGDVPRYRDCYWDGTHICLYTRTGGGNRPDYVADNDRLTHIEGYAYDADDHYDSTYATFYFVPTAPVAAALSRFRAADATPEQKWQSLLERLNNTGPEPDPQVERVVQTLGPILDRIAHAIAAKK